MGSQIYYNHLLCCSLKSCQTDTLGWKYHLVKHKMGKWGYLSVSVHDKAANKQQMHTECMCTWLMQQYKVHVHFTRMTTWSKSWSLMLKTWSAGCVQSVVVHNAGLQGAKLFALQTKWKWVPKGRKVGGGCGRGSKKTVDHILMRSWRRGRADIIFICPLT